jgi:hypothetical protein
MGATVLVERRHQEDIQRDRQPMRHRGEAEDNELDTTVVRIRQARSELADLRLGFLEMAALKVHASLPEEESPNLFYSSTPSLHPARPHARREVVAEGVQLDG